MKAAYRQLLAAALVAMVVPAAFAKDDDATPVDAERMAMIDLNLLGRAFAMYLSDHDEKWPENLEELAPYHDRPEAMHEHEYLYLRPISAEYGDDKNSIPIVYEKRAAGLLILHSAGHVTSEKDDIRPEVKPSSVLEFHIVPLRVGGDSSSEYLRLLKQGLTGYWWVGKAKWSGSLPYCIWLPVRKNIPLLGGMLAGEHRGRTFLLVSNTLNEVMHAPSNGGPAWGLTKVRKHDDSLGRPTIAISLDKAGRMLLNDLSGQLLAVVIDGEIVSVLTFESVLAQEEIIVGPFNKAAIQGMVEGLQTGMPATRAEQCATNPAETAEHPPLSVE